MRGRFLLHNSMNESEERTTAGGVLTGTSDTSEFPSARPYRCDPKHCRGVWNIDPPYLSKSGTYPRASG